MTGLRTLLESPSGSLAVAVLILGMALMLAAVVHWHRGAPVEAASVDTAPNRTAPIQTAVIPSAVKQSDVIGSAPIGPGATGHAERVRGSTTATAEITTTDVTRVEPPAYNATHAVIAAYVGRRSFWPGRRFPSRTDLDESPQVFWFLVAPLIAATAAAVLFAVYSEAIVNTVRGVAFGAALVAIAALVSGNRQRDLPTLWWAGVVAVALGATLWSCYLLTHGAYGHEVLLLRHRADGRSLPEAYHIMLHRFGFEGALGLISKALGAAVVAAVGCYVTFRLCGVLAAVEAVKRTDPGTWHQDLVERVYPRGGPRNAAVLVVLVSLLGVGLSGGHLAHGLDSQLHRGDSAGSVAPHRHSAPSTAPHTIKGTAHADVLALTERPDRVFALGGNDRIIVPADGVKDIVNCSDGQDRVVLLGRREPADRFIACENVIRR